MRGRAIIPLVVGLGVGLMALKVFVNVLQKAQGATSETVPVVFTTTDIEPTIEIQESMVEVKNVPKEAAPDTGFADIGEVVGRVTSWPIPKGAAIGAMQLAPIGTPPGMAVRITDGYRAVAVKIDESVGVAGWIKPGSRVDVVALLSSPDRCTQGSISKTILQNVEVLAVGQEIGTAGDTAAAVTSTVTLLLPPADVPKLHLAETKGRLRLAMRNPHDTGLNAAKVTTDNDLLSLASTEKRDAKASTAALIAAFLAKQAKNRPAQTDKEPEPKAVQAKAWTVELHKGVEAIESVKFERDAHAWHRIEQKSSGSRSGGLRPAGKVANPVPTRLLPAPGRSPDSET